MSTDGATARWNPRVVARAPTLHSNRCRLRTGVEEPAPTRPSNPTGQSMVPVAIVSILITRVFRRSLIAPLPDHSNPVL